MRFINRPPEEAQLHDSSMETNVTTSGRYPPGRQ